MLYRDSMLAVGALLFALPNVAFAASFGTRTSAGISPFEGGAGVVVTDLLTDARPTTTWAWLADGPSNAAAGTPFGSNHAEAISAPGTATHAASLWSETFTITSLWGATGTASVSFELFFDGSLDAGLSPAGSA